MNVAVTTWLPGASGPPTAALSAGLVTLPPATGGGVPGPAPSTVRTFPSNDAPVDSAPPTVA